MSEKVAHAESSHRHQCWKCHRTWPGYGSHYGNRALCSDGPLTLCHVCLSKLFPDVQIRRSEAYREIRVAMIDEAEKRTNEKVGMLTNGFVRVEWTRTFLKQMNKLSARI